MNYEERYKEALERAKKQLESANVFDYEEAQIAHDIRTTVYEIFPELAESEDERIRKEIIEYLKLHDKGENDYAHPMFSKWFAWLEKQKENKFAPRVLPCSAAWFEDGEEKQKEQKPVKPKIKYVYPKFRIGDVISYNQPGDGYINDYTIVGFSNELPDYLVDGGNVPSCSIGIEFIDNNYHLKEQKFKVGDTIRCKYDDRVFTIKEVNLETGTYTYTREGYGNDIDYADENFELLEQKPVDLSKMMVHKEPYIAPVPTPMVADEQKPVEKPSKEDYVKKFKALCDAYEIKLPNREYDIYHLCMDLHKLFGDIQKPVEYPEKGNEYWFGFNEGKGAVLDHPEEYGLQKPVEWSEEDEETIRDAINRIEQLDHYWNRPRDEKLIKRLKSLRPSWQIAYRQIVYSIFKMLEGKDFRRMPSSCVSLLNDIRVKCKDAIECAPILDKPSWKPSEEQMTMLRAVLNDPNNAGAESCQLALSGLYEQLKKLM